MRPWATLGALLNATRYYECLAKAGARAWGRTPNERQKNPEANMNRLMVVCAVLVLGLATSVTAQVDVATATLKGSITDQSGAFVPGANVTVTSTERGVSKNTISDSSGNYQIPLL